MRSVALALIAAALLLPGLAEAYVPSPQYGAFELKFGPYTPNVDDEPGLTGTPYRDALNNDTMFLTMLELDWQFLQLRGINFGVGGAFGFMQAYAKAQTESGGQSADYTVLNVMPFNLLAVIRVHALASELGVPLVPFFKVGLNWYVWWVLDGGGDTAVYTDDDGKSHKANGGTLGWQINPGIAIELDSLDRMSARTFDNEVGVNHSYLFFEYVYAQVEGYGRDGYMYLSPTNLGNNGTFMIGLALEF
jgi:hypothetical protein